MRVFVLALAILLLPLRGWVGDAMAVGMVQHAPPSTSAPAQDHAAHMQGASHAAHGATHEAAPDAPAAHDDCRSTCGTCQLCQLCHTVAIGLPPDVPLLNVAPREAPAFRPTAFASAEPSAGLKPPIS